MSTLYLLPLSLIPQWFSNLGVMAAGGSVQTYQAGTTTPVTTYTDASGAVPNPNPMTLSASGRPVSASGAPVAFWVSSGTSVLFIVYDASGNQLQSLDHVGALNDPLGNTSTLQSQLASPASSNASGVGPVAGADLVANAVKSYDTFSDLRQANTPSLAVGQTLIVSLQGATTVGDAGGGDFYWNPTSTAADNGVTVIKPASAGIGRYLRLVLPENAVAINAGSFTATTTDVTGGTSSALIYWTLQGNTVTLCSPTTFTGTSASTTFSLAGAPALIQPLRTQQQSGVLVNCEDNTVACGAVITVAPSGVITFGKVAAGAAVNVAWTGSGTKAIGPFNYTYLLN